jgi:DNA topoisomerase-1
MAISEVMRKVSSVLGNTPAICRKCYVHPAIVQAYLDGRLPDLMSACVDGCIADADEMAVAKLLTEAAETMHSNGKAYVA